MRYWSRNRGQGIGDGRRHARMPQVFGGGTGAPPVFASVCETVTRSTNISTTNTVTYVNALTLAPGALMAGDYWLEVDAYYSQSNIFEGDCQMQLTQDTVEIANNRGHSNGSGAARADAKNLFANHRIVTLAAGVHTWALNFRVGSPSAGGDTAAVFWARLNLWSF